MEGTQSQAPVGCNYEIYSGCRGRSMCRYEEGKAGQPTARARPDVHVPSTNPCFISDLSQFSLYIELRTLASNPILSLSSLQ